MSTPAPSKQARFRILSVDGGGYFGLASAQCLASLEEHLTCDFRKAFDLYCGTSTGAILVLGLASGKSGAELVNLYESLGEQVFGRWNPARDLALGLRGMFQAKYPLKPLRVSLASVFREATLADVLASGKRVLVAAHCLSNGRPRIFKTDHSSNFSLHGGYRLADVAMASSAAPTYFPVVELRAPKSGAIERFCDGGIYANHPALLGLVEAVSELGIPPSAVDIVSVSTRRPYLEAGSGRHPSLNRGAWGWRKLVGQVVGDSSAGIAHETLLRLARQPFGSGMRYQRIEIPAPDGTELDKVTRLTTDALRRAGSDVASDRDIRERVALLLS